VAAWSERKLIDRIQKIAPKRPDDVLLSIGDDCCELATGPCTLISTDTLVDSVHFDTSFHPPYLLGRKSIAVNLSDIAAMGGVPRFVLLSLCLPADLEQEWIDTWIDGALSMLQEFNCILVGGDTVKGNNLVFTVTVLGEPLSEGAVYRSGATVGDSVWVSGLLGSAGAGLGIMNFEKGHSQKIHMNAWGVLCDAHLDPVPQIRLGQKLTRSNCVTAMQDISDGLATDLAHICQASKVSATIDLFLLPEHISLREAADFLGVDTRDLLLRAGEDYQLVFTVKKDQEKTFIDSLGTEKQLITKIGKINEGAGLFLQVGETIEDISFQGYEHN
jgi:thiamine-monophosphate kinase